MTEKPITIENRTLFRSLGVVALPIALQSLITSSLSLVDNLMVGAVSESALAATGLATQFYFIQWMMLFGFTSGCATFMAQFWGVQDLKNIRKVVGFAITVCFSVSMLFFLVAIFVPQIVIHMFTNIPEIIEMGKGYVRMGALCFLCTSITVPLTSALRTTQQTLVPLKISVTAFTMNTCLNYVFIFGHFGFPAMSVRGAALATTISRVVEMSLVLYVIFGRKNKLAGPLRDFFGWERSLIQRIVRNAIPTTINETMWGLGTAAYNAAYGRIGVTAFAAMQASTTINNMFVLASFSLGDAMLILTGQYLGKGQLDHAYEMAKKILKVGVGVGLVLGCVLILSSRIIVGFFEFTPEGKYYAVRILTVFGCCMAMKLFAGMNITGCLRAGGDTRYAMLMEISTMWLIGVPIAFFGALYLELPIYVVVVMVQLEEVVKVVLCFRRFRSKKWLKNVIHGI